MATVFRLRTCFLDSFAFAAKRQLSISQVCCRHLLTACPVSSYLVLDRRKTLWNRRCASTWPERLVARSPKYAQPYLRLMRWDKPIGSWLLFWPCGWSVALAADPGSLPSVSMLVLMGVGTVVMRGAGCTVNDMLDKDFDAKVERTKNRPLACGEICMVDALGFLAGQLSVALFILLQLNWYSIVLGASSLVLVFTYPLMKRITDWPQLPLGLAFNWGALMGWAAIHGSCDWSVCLPLYASGIAWTLIYDTIYAHQDRTDDLVIGVRSTAIKFKDKTQQWLTGFSTVMITGLITTGLITDQTVPYFVSVAVTASLLSKQISTLKIDDADDCRRKFLFNRHIGLIIFLGIVSSNLFKVKKPSVDSSTAEVQLTFEKV